MNYLIVPICFPDTDAYVNWPLELLDTMIFDVTKKSVSHFYNDVSFDKVQIVTDQLPSQLGWLQAPYSYTYYTNGQYGLGQQPQNVQGLAIWAFSKLDSLGIDFSKYDNDKNGYVDGIGFITCLPGAEATQNTNYFWSVKWGIAPKRYDNVWVGQSFFLAAGRYTNDHGSTPRLGVITHEIGHMFGFADHYAGSWGGTGNFDLMANGAWNGNGQSPAGLIGFNYIKLGWVQPVEIFPGMGPITDTLQPIFREPKIYKIYMANGNLREYWLLIVRGDTLHDRTIPGFGLTIERASEIGSQSKPWCATNTNYLTGKPLVMLEQADGLCSMASGSRGDNTDPFPLTNNFSFTTTSYPPSVYYNLTPTGLSITNIKRLDNTKMSPISFTLSFCDCGIHGDLNDDKVINFIDVQMVVEIAFRGGEPTKWPNCNYYKADLDLNGYINMMDVARMINYAFRGQTNAIKNPCQ